MFMVSLRFMMSKQKTTESCCLAFSWIFDVKTHFIEGSEEIMMPFLITKRSLYRIPLLFKLTFSFSLRPDHDSSDSKSAFSTKATYLLEGLAVGVTSITFTAMQANAIEISSKPQDIQVRTIEWLFNYSCILLSNYLLIKHI